MRGIQFEQILAAQQRIAGYIRRTPTYLIPFISEGREIEIALKLENLQETGSFKIRGAANKILKLNKTQRDAGVIAVSTGNHGRAVAHMAGRLGIRAVICLSRQTAPLKIAAIRKLGAVIHEVGDSYDEATEYARRMSEEKGLTFIEPFDDPDIIAGQGTIGLEMIESAPSLDSIMVPMSGGGLISGIGLAYKHAHPQTRLVGVTMSAGAVMAASLERGKIVHLVEEPTLADALVGGLGEENQYTFTLCQRLVDEVILVDEQDIAEAVVFALNELQLIVEGGGAVGIAAVRSGRAKDLGKRLGLIISGGNIDLRELASLQRGD